MNDTVRLSGDVEEHVRLYAEAFNSGDADRVNAMYTEEAVAVWEPGKPLSGREREESVVEFLARGPRMNAEIRHSYVTGDTALLVVDWTIDGPGEDGTDEHHEGVGLDVLRRGADGNWRYAIDEPFSQAG
ncbi:YybH family protein [Streptomyces marincola]|uniref:YybH family protein n=1 Tax=Streptomyces marincola TaxID=2878388 RepID=UPI001CF4C62E|nr:SgcJ/EcaC family oxidoreductase [Streptomyces marincola]UCM87586.1 SgcJ/EcaC family oxidoreductase [Streptomyces marincola]